MSATERLLLWLLVIVALLLGAYATYETTEINTKGQALSEWADSAQAYIKHWHDAHHPPQQGPGDHQPPPPPPPPDW